MPMPYFNNSLILVTYLLILNYIPAWGANQGQPYKDFPPIYHAGRKIDCGYPLLGQVLHLSSLTPQQRQQIQMIRDSTAKQMDDLKQRQKVLQQNIESARRSSNDQQYIQQSQYYLQQLRSQFHKVRREGWFAARALLRPEQIQELRQQAIDSAPKN